MTSRKKIISNLERSNRELENFISYASAMRSKILKTIQSAHKYGYTYVDLDTIDGARCQVLANKDMIAFLKNKKGAV